jgi:hypothetical protein
MWEEARRLLDEAVSGVKLVNGVAGWKVVASFGKADPSWALPLLRLGEAPLLDGEDDAPLELISTGATTHVVVSTPSTLVVLELPSGARVGPARAFARHHARGRSDA